MSVRQQEAQGSGGRLHPAAYRELQAGETYEPYVPAGAAVPEFTVRSVTLGIVMVIIFSVASTYSGLKIAQVMEAAIPISILAVGVSGLFVRKNTILENVIVQSIGGASGLVVSGSIFTLPALYIMNVAPGTLSMLLTIFVVSVLGSYLGLLFLIPLRRYFVVEQHGKLPFPEATAINEVYVTGEKGGEQARTLVVAACVGGALRLPGRHRPGLERDGQLPVHPRGEEPGDDVQGHDQPQRDRDDRGPRLHHGAAVLGHHLRRRLLLGAGRRARWSTTSDSTSRRSPSPRLRCRDSRISSRR